MRVLKWSENAVDIKKLWKRKQDNEFALANELVDYFNEEPLIQMLCILANEALKDLMTGADPNELKEALKGKGPSPFLFWQPARIEKRIKDAPRDLQPALEKLPWARADARAAVFQGIVANDLAQCFDAADCGDIFCIYGDFVENCKAPRSKDYFKSSKKMPQQLSPKTFKKAQPQTQEEKELKPDVKHDEKQPYRLVHEDYRQARRKPRIQKDWNGAGGPIDFFKKPPKGAPKEVQDTLSCRDFRIRGTRKEVRGEKDVARKKGQLEGKARLAEGVMPGLARFTLDPKSSIRQIDKMFGLKRGADISGTTADTVFGLETLMYSFHAGIHQGKKEQWKDKDVAKWMEDALRIKEILYLLPLATMGAQAHHTILECAFTLSINDYIDYSIGMYTTLIPKHWDLAFWDKTHRLHKTRAPITRPFRDAVMKLVGILNRYETISHNPLILQCYESPNIKNPIQVYEFNKESHPQKALFWMISNLRRNMRGWASQLYSADLRQRYPSKELLENAIKWWARRLGVDLDRAHEDLDEKDPRFDPVKASEAKDRTSLDREFAEGILKKPKGKIY